MEISNVKSIFDSPMIVYTESLMGVIVLTAEGRMVTAQQNAKELLRRVGYTLDERELKDGWLREVWVKVEG